MIELRAIIISSLLLTLARTIICDDDSSSRESPSQDSSLAHATWCRISNGTYLALGYSYMHSLCTMCQCTKSRAIRCSVLDCMPTYCVDGSAPVRKTGQCCTRCGYDTVYKSTSDCVYNGITYQHGVTIKSVTGKMTCWCQLGNIECRTYGMGAAQAIDILSDTTAIYIVVLVVMIALVAGTTLCCGCTLFYYYYYHRYQQTMQQQYDEYVNSAGWQPMTDENPNATDKSALEKQFEAEKYQGTTGIIESVPPPYAGYGDSFTPVDQQKQQ